MVEDPARILAVAVIGDVPNAGRILHGSAGDERVAYVFRNDMRIHKRIGLAPLLRCGGVAPTAPATTRTTVLAHVTVSLVPELPSVASSPRLRRLGHNVEVAHAALYRVRDTFSSRPRQNNAAARGVTIAAIAMYSERAPTMRIMVNRKQRNGQRANTRTVIGSAHLVAPSRNRALANQMLTVRIVPPREPA